jgi:hypothetical protein
MGPVNQGNSENLTLEKKNFGNNDLGDSVGIEKVGAHRPTLTGQL